LRRRRIPSSSPAGVVDADALDVIRDIAEHLTAPVAVTTSTTTPSTATIRSPSVPSATWLQGGHEDLFEGGRGPAVGHARLSVFGTLPSTILTTFPDKAKIIQVDINPSTSPAPIPSRWASSGRPGGDRRDPEELKAATEGRKPDPRRLAAVKKGGTPGRRRS
jgi:sulfoacetaldehyde acetyltransferase